MKICFLNICLLVLLLSCSKGSDKEQKSETTNGTATEKSGKDQSIEQEIVSLESEMINFFQETLEKNYGHKDAIDLLVKGMDKYYFTYILEVDKPRLQEINKKFYTNEHIFTYFLNTNQLDNDSNIVFAPKGMTLHEYTKSAKFQQDLKKRNLDRSKVIYVPDSALYMSYAPTRTKIENVVLPLTIYAKDDFSYYNKELSQASHPAMKAMAETMYSLGGTVSPSLIWETVTLNQKNIRSDFKSDRDIQMFLTLYFWNFLCHSANIDFYTGKDRTAILLEEEAHK